VAVLAVGRNNRIIGRERLDCADGNRLLADAQMKEASDFRCTVKFRTFLLEASNAHHLT
jgi:hypothetical protein